jgi:hypothetical protein
MVSLQIKLVGSFAILILVLAGTNSFFTNAYAQKLSKNQLKQCEHLYFNYKKFGESEFLKRYEFKSFIKECIKLYNDPKWTFIGKEKVDKYFETSVNVKNIEKENSKPKINIIKKIKVDNSRYLTSFAACATNHVMPNFLLSSDKEQFIGTSSKIISSNTCRTFSTYLITQNPISISVEHIADQADYPHLKVKML